MSVSVRPMRAILGLPLLAIVATGCSFETTLRYPAPLETHPPAIASVAVRTVNSRPEGHGGQTKCVGRVRGGYGNPFPIYERDAANIERTVKAATEEALLGAGVAVGEDSPLVLVAVIKEFWIDGWGAFNATVHIDYSLQERSGVAVWERSVSATGGDIMRMSVFEAEAISATAFEQALMGVATQLKKEFIAEDFQKRVRSR